MGQPVYVGLYRKSRGKGRNRFTTRLPCLMTERNAVVEKRGRNYFLLDSLSEDGPQELPFGKVEITYSCLGNSFDPDCQVECYTIRGLDGVQFEKWPSVNHNSESSNVCCIFRQVPRNKNKPKLSGWIVRIGEQNWDFVTEPHSSNFRRSCRATRRDFILGRDAQRVC